MIFIVLLPELKLGIQVLKSVNVFFLLLKHVLYILGGRNEDGLAHVVVMKSMRYDGFFCYM